MPKPPCPGVEDHRRGGGHGRDKSRKYAINLLNGNIVFQESKGLGKTYKDDVKPVLAAIWNEVGCPCAPRSHILSSNFFMVASLFLNENRECSV